MELLSVRVQQISLVLLVRIAFMRGEKRRLFRAVMGGQGMHLIGIQAGLRYPFGVLGFTLLVRMI